MKRIGFYVAAFLCCLHSTLLSAGTPATLNVGSFNIRVNNAGDGINAWPKRVEKVKALIQFHEYDVVGLQEALPEQMHDLLAMQGFVSVGEGRDGQNTGEASAILYRTDRVEILNKGTFWLSPTPDKVSKGWDAALNRVCSWAKMRDRKSHKIFYYFNTHFDHMGHVARAESAKLLVSRIAEIAGDKYPVLCTGDFNSPSTDEPIQIMRAALHDAELVSVMAPYGPTWSFTQFDVKVPEALKKSGKIDFLFVNDRVTVEKYGLLTDSDGSNHPSDHFPLFARVRFK